MDFFKGTRYFLSDMWFNVIDLTEFINRPINYLEIGTFYGANLFSVANSYGIHLESKLHCIDPWDQYSDYDEYINQHSDIYSTFVKTLVITKIKIKSQFIASVIYLFIYLFIIYYQ